MMQVCTIACGQTLPTTSGSPFSPSQTTKNTSLMPRLRRSVSTLIQNLAPSPPTPAHSPRMSFSPLPLEYSIDWLTCAFASTLGVVMVGLAGAAQDHVLAYVPGARLGRTGVPR